MKGNRKPLIILLVLVALAVVLLIVGYIAKSDPEPEPTAISSAVEETVPSDVWEEDEATGYNSFTTLEQLGIEEGCIGVLSIERIDLSVQVYDSDENTVMEDMKHGAAHYKSTSYFDGNVGFSAHNGNASYSFFDRLPELEEGDIIVYTTNLGTREYQVVSSVVIADDDWSYLERTEDNRVTLTTCVTGQPANRLCVQAVEITV